MCYWWLQRAAMFHVVGQQQVSFVWRRTETLKTNSLTTGQQPIFSSGSWSDIRTWTEKILSAGWRTSGPEKHTHTHTRSSCSIGGWEAELRAELRADPYRIGSNWGSHWNAVRSSFPGGITADLRFSRVDEHQKNVGETLIFKLSPPGVGVATQRLPEPRILERHRWRRRLNTSQSAYDVSQRGKWC